MIVETRIHGRIAEPSQGTHFFQNITSLGIGYLSIDSAYNELGKDNSFIDWTWLHEHASVSAEHKGVRHIRLNIPITVHLDGRHSKAMILKPR